MNGDPGERERGDDIDRAARRVMGLVIEGAVEREMMQPALWTADKKMNGEPREGSASVAISSTVRREVWWGWLARVGGGGGNDVSGTVDGQRKDEWGALGSASVAMTPTVPQGEWWRRLTRWAGGGNEAASTVDGQRKDEWGPRGARAWR
eukprot:jgi/Undpi1/932/HiC_scaffold_10.g04396.m1